MHNSTEITGTLKRSSTLTRARILSILSCLDARAELEGNLSENAILAVLKFSYPGVPPRFLFGLSTNDKVIRSPDKGESWIELPLDASSVAPDSCADVPCVSKDSEEAKSLPKNALASNYPRRPRAHSHFTHICSFEDIVVVGGNDGVLLISTNKGLKFYDVEVLFLHWKDHKDITGMCILNNECVAVTNGYVVTLVTFLMNSCLCCTSVSDVYEISSSGDIFWIGCSFRTSGCCELIISQPSLLSVSWDDGKTFTSFPHNLGRINACDCLLTMRCSELPKFPILSRVVSSILCTDVKSGSSQYEYSCITTASVPNRTLNLAKKNLLSMRILSDDKYSALSSYQSKFLYRFFFVVGVGTPVLPFDFSGILCIGMHYTSQSEVCSKTPVSLFTLGDKIEYIPYSRSMFGVPLSCVVSRLTPEQKTANSRKSIFAGRANSAIGTSFSKDFSDWEDASTSATVSLIASDGGEILVCTQRNVLMHVQVAKSADGGQNVICRYALSKEMRIPSILAVCSS